MNTRVSVTALIAAGLLLTGCSGGSGRAAPDPSPSRSGTPGPTASATRTASPRPSASRSPSRRPSPSVSPSPVVTGKPVGVDGSALQLVSGGAVKSFGPASDDCAALYPDLVDVSCDEVKLNGGSVLWVAGTATGRWTLLLHVFDEPAGGYRLRYRADDATGAWTGFRLGATELTGYGVDGLVVATIVRGEAPRRMYDVLTWRKGGPLVLRAHRPPLPNGRVLLAKGRVDEYEALYAAGDSPCCPRRYAYRRLAWNGRQFLIQTVGPVPAARVPAAD